MKKDTKGIDYADRLDNLANKGWKRFLNVQLPYIWNLRRLNPGKTLDVGCGIGRNLAHLSKASVGVDHNPFSVEKANSLGLIAYTYKDFVRSKHAKKLSYDSILLGHVIEHMNYKDNRAMLKSYLPYLKEDGKIIIMCPQEKGYKSDSTHVSMYDFSDLAALLGDIGFTVKRAYSFPFPRSAGKVFKYNEFVVMAKRTGLKSD